MSNFLIRTYVNLPIFDVRFFGILSYVHVDSTQAIVFGTGTVWVLVQGLVERTEVASYKRDPKFLTLLTGNTVLYHL